MTDPLKVAKLIDRIQNFATRLEKERDFTVHRHISDFYYMQKIAELHLLQEQLEEALNRVSFLGNKIEQEYSCIFVQWHRDLKWLNKYLKQVSQL